KAGTIEYQAGKLGPPFAKGTIPLVAIRFESSGGIADTSLVFSNNGPIQRTAVYRAGVNVLRQTIDGNVTIAAPTATPTNTPAATATATPTPSPMGAA